MGVKPCSRRGCKSVMCDRYSSRYGYICNDCFQALVRCGPDINIDAFLQIRRSPDEAEEAE